MTQEQKELAVDILKDLNTIFSYDEIGRMIDFNQAYLSQIAKGKEIWDKLTKALLSLTVNQKNIESKYFTKDIIVKKKLNKTFRE